MHSRIAAAFCAVVIAACAAIPGYGLKPGLSTEREVRESFGKPAMEMVDAGGGRLLAYTTGPLGTETWMARIAPDGKLAALEQVLDQKYLQQIRPGSTTGEEVLRLIGPPWRKEDFERKGQVAWDYRLQDIWGYYVDYSVMVDRRGIVAETAYVRIESGRDSRR